MDSTWFDDLTKALATPSSRRQALQRIGGMLTGAIVATWPFGHALADNSDCAHFCNSVFDPGPARGQCKSDAAHGTGLCFTCGPASPGGTQPICCPQNSDGTCTSYSSATCCSDGQVCQDGMCVTPTTTTTPPPCQGVNGSCVNTSDCCTGLFCEDQTSTCVTCLPSGHGLCNPGPASLSGCCAGLECDSQTLTCVSCLPSGVPCSPGDKCCSGTCNTSTGTCP
jgi:hypothetical protein